MISLLMTWRIRHVPRLGGEREAGAPGLLELGGDADGEGVDPQARAGYTDTWPQPTGSSTMSPTTSSMPEKSAVDSDVSATSS